MDRRGGHAAGSSSQGRSAWNTPLHPKPRIPPPDGRLPGPSNPAMAIKSPALSFNPQQNPAYSFSDDDSESGGEGGAQVGRNVDALESSIMADYPSTEDMDATGVAKIRSLLLARRSGATSCLICLERVRATDPVWDCKAGCHAIFHLICIQSWARQALGAAALRSLGQLSSQHFPAAQAEAEDKACWHCPKCRTDYQKSELPREYRCFCGKQEDPVNDPWLAPHTCGEKCGRSLPGECGHECVLLCHPGPCPTCPQLLKFRCFCGAESEMRRCGHRNFSCGRECKKVLSCGKHKCESACHEGDCPPCSKTAIHKCQCGQTSAVRACAESNFRCENPCGRQLPCLKHWCQRGCHSGPCGECLLTGKRSCPCGKVEHKGIPCDVVIPTCGSTCEKVLPCEIHRCSERCHYGPCKEVCRVVLTKSCRCGSLKKEVPCHQELQCERKCQRMRDCGRHACKRRCCDGDCPLCSEVCGRRLKCGNHKCPAPCHRGLCAPCPVNVQITCACGETAIQVPCGTERTQRPPRCTKLCAILPKCSHGASCKPHRCHYGACPECQLPCMTPLPCGHSCKESCHGPKPTPNPEYTYKTKKKRVMHDKSTSTGEPCPPCSERIVKKCLGQHQGSERTMVCSQSSEFRCSNACGNPLACGNHTCRSTCHFVTIPRIVAGEEVFQLDKLSIPPGIELGEPTNVPEGVWGKYGASLPHEKCTSNGSTEDTSNQPDNLKVVDSCEQCRLPCQKKRALQCPHPCTQRCHIASCKPCKAILKRACHCEALVQSFECTAFNSVSEAARAKLLSCGGPCHRKLPNCAHLCPDICHPGVCPTAADSCRKKVTVRCACQRLKKEWLCCDAQAAQPTKGTQKSAVSGVGILPCDQECSRLAAERRAKEESEELRHRKSKEPEVNAAPVKTSKKRRGRNFEDATKTSGFLDTIAAAGRWIMLFLLLVVVLVALVYGYKGLLALSRWMDARDAARPRRRMPRSF